MTFACSDVQGHNVTALVTSDGDVGGTLTELIQHKCHLVNLVTA